MPAHLPRDLREHAGSAHSPDNRLTTALADWLDTRLSEKAAWRDIHDTLEDMALRHLLTRFEGKPTVLARETKMNRVTLRKKFARR